MAAVSEASSVGFSAVTTTKLRLWSRPAIRDPLQASLSPITPRGDRLVAGKLAQGSH